MADILHTSNRLPKGVTVESFVVVWQKSESVAEVAAKIGMERYDASGLASFLRRSHKVPLKHFRKDSKAKFDGATLRQLALENAP